jgi:hypothetical protein
MASRATKGVVLKTTNSHRVLRDHVRKDQLSVTRCTVHPSHSLAARPPIVASIEHFHPHPEVTRYGDELVVLIWLWREDLTMQAPYARTYCPRKSATTRLRRPGATTCSSCTVDACLIRGAACMGMGGVSVSRPSLMNTTRRSEPWHPEQMNVWCSTPRAATVSSGTTFVRINSAPQALQRITCTPTALTYRTLTPLLAMPKLCSRLQKSG